MIIAASPMGLCGVWFTDQRHLPPDTVLARWPHKPAHAVLRLAVAQMTAYFKGRGQFDLPLDLGAGTAFQQSVWQALLRIPSGQTTSYGAISQQINNPKAARAVGAAVGRNPVGIVVPCHRVLGADGSLTGYAGGLSRKGTLLKLENVFTFADGRAPPHLFPSHPGQSNCGAQKALPFPV